MLDFESETMRDPGSIPTWGNILSLDFFHVVRASDANIGILPILSICEKPELSGLSLKIQLLRDSIVFYCNYSKLPYLVKCKINSVKSLPPIEFFTVYTKLAEMAVLASKDLSTAKKKLPPVGLDLMQEIITDLRFQCLTN